MPGVLRNVPELRNHVTGEDAIVVAIAALWHNRDPLVGKHCYLTRSQAQQNYYSWRCAPDEGITGLALLRHALGRLHDSNNCSRQSS